MLFFAFIDNKSYAEVQHGRCANLFKNELKIVPFHTHIDWAFVQFNHNIVLLDINEQDIIRSVVGTFTCTSCNYVRPATIVEINFIRDQACKDAKTAWLFAMHVDKQARTNTRKGACMNPYCAFEYAYHLDKCSRDDTREAACHGAQSAYEYALYIDKYPRDDTRLGASREPKSAFHYALSIDKKAHATTRNSACNDPWYRHVYERVFDKQK